MISLEQLNSLHAADLVLYYLQKGAIRMKKTSILWLMAGMGITMLSSHAQNAPLMRGRVAAAPTQPTVSRASVRGSIVHANDSRLFPGDCRKSCIPFRRNCSRVFLYYGYSGYPYGYPVYYSSYPIYGYAPAYSDSSGGYQSDSRMRSSNDEQEYDKSYEDDYWRLGRDWGQDLRRDVASFEDFMAFVKKRISPAPESLRDQFRLGFSRGYGQRADEAFQKAMDLASQPESQSNRTQEATY
jgi:hypothetical protein